MTTLFAKELSNIPQTLTPGPQGMIVTINLYGLLEYLFLPSTGLSDDEAEVIGLSRVAFLSQRDPAHRFLPEARWHDAAYQKGASIQDTWQRWEVDAQWLSMMLENAAGNLDAEQDAILLWLLVRKHGAKAWEGIPDDEHERLSFKHGLTRPVKLKLRDLEESKQSSSDHIQKATDALTEAAKQGFRVDKARVGIDLDSLNRPIVLKAPEDAEKIREILSPEEPTEILISAREDLAVALWNRKLIGQGDFDKMLAGKPFTIKVI